MSDAEDDDGLDNIDESLDINDFDESDDDHDMHWETAAKESLTYALETARLDDLRGSVYFPSEAHEGYYDECTSVEEIARYLESKYDEQFYANVPFDKGPVFESDPDDDVADALASVGDRFEVFFAAIKQPDDTEEVVTSEQLVETAKKSQLLQLDFKSINAELIAYFAKHPKKLRDVSSRDFEQLMADLFKNLGYDVTLTKATRDGGKDLITCPQE
jgi:hypothetical protein